MEDLSAELIIAVGAAALFGALGYKYLIDTMIKLNRELQESARERQQDEKDREALKDRIDTLEDELKDCRELIERQGVLEDI